MPASPDSLAEIQAAQALTAAGFTEVRALPVKLFRRTADLIGDFKGRRFALEVRRASRSLKADGVFSLGEDGKPLPYPTLDAYFAMVWRDKQTQLAATQQEERCQAGALLVVLEGERSQTWESLLEAAWLAAGRPHDVYFTIVHGQDLLWQPQL